MALLAAEAVVAVEPADGEHRLAADHRSAGDEPEHPRPRQTGGGRHGAGGHQLARGIQALLVADEHARRETATRGAASMARAARSSAPGAHHESSSHRDT